MARVKNLTNSPYDLPLRGGGTVRIGAMGDIVDADIDPEYLAALRAGSAMEVLPDAPKIPEMPRHPLDHDGDGKPGGSLPAIDGRFLNADNEPVLPPLPGL